MTYLKLLSFTKQWVNFLINVYKLVEEYPGIQQVGISMRNIRINLKLIHKVLEDNKDEWKNFV